MTTGTKRTLIILGIVAAILVVGCIGAAIIGVFVVGRSMEAMDFGPPQGIVIDADLPARVELGDAFTIEVTIRNTASEDQLLDSIDIYDTYADGMDIERSEPAWRDASHLGDFMTYDYQRDIPAESELVVIFHVRAAQNGAWSGDLDVCVNTSFSYVTEVITTQVGTPAPAAEAELETEASDGAD